MQKDQNDRTANQSQDVISHCLLGPTQHEEKHISTRGRRDPDTGQSDTENLSNREDVHVQINHNKALGKHLHTLIFTLLTRSLTQMNKRALYRHGSSPVPNRTQEYPLCISAEHF